MLFLDKVNYGLGEIHEAYWKMLTDNMRDGYSIDSAESQDFLLNDLNKQIKRGKLLEVGSGDGSFLKRAKDAGWDVTGIELSKEAVRIARQKYGIDCLRGTLEQVFPQLQGVNFDIMVMWGVIEHLQNPQEVLKIAKSLLKKGGLLIIYTPNANSIFHRLARAVYYATLGVIRFPMERVIIAMHLMYFTPDTLRSLINKCYFSIKKIEMRDISLDFIFNAHKNFRWSNKMTLRFAKLLQRASHISSMHSHMIVFAEST